MELDWKNAEDCDNKWMGKIIDFFPILSLTEREPRVARALVDVSDAAEACDMP